MRTLLCAAAIAAAFGLAGWNDLNVAVQEQAERPPLFDWNIEAQADTGLTEREIERPADLRIATLCK